MRHHGIRIDSATGTHQLDYWFLGLAQELDFQLAGPVGEPLGVGMTLQPLLYDFNWAATEADRCRKKVLAFKRDFTEGQPYDRERAIKEVKEFDEPYEALPRYLEVCLVKLVSMADVMSVLVPHLQLGTKRAKPGYFTRQLDHFLENDHDPEYAKLLQPLHDFAGLRNLVVHRTHHRGPPMIQTYPDGRREVKPQLSEYTFENGVYTKRHVENLFDEVRVLNSAWCEFLDGTYELFLSRAKGKKLLVGSHRSLGPAWPTEQEYEWAYPSWTV